MIPSPQLEDGFTRIANELLEALLGFGLSGRQLHVALTVVRKTYGYGKKQDDMSASQIGQICGIERHHVTEVIGQLVKMNVLIRATGSYGIVLGINKNYREWREKTSPKKGLCPNSGLVLIRDKSSPNLGQVDSPNLGHTKENLPKENQKKITRSEIFFDDWLANAKELGIKPIPEDHAVFKYADKVELPMDFIRLCWLEFKNTFSGNRKKRYADWAKAFSNYVRKNYFRLWFEKDGQFQLTTAGIQLQKEMANS